MKENPVKMVPEGILEAIGTASNVVLFTHIHPDGDALGSLFGLVDILESFAKNVFCFCEEPIAEIYSFLPTVHKANTSMEAYRGFVNAAGEDLIAIALDCGSDDRLGKFKQEFLKIKSFVVIDHHSSHEDFGTMRWVEPGCSSTGEMVYELARELGVEISYNCAYNLYMAICTDTGSFRYECTQSRTLYIAAKLLEKGVRPEEICRHIYENFTGERLKLLQMALSTLSLCQDGQVAFMHVSCQMFEDSGTSLQDTEGFIEFPRSLRSVKVAALIKEVANGVINVSLRAKGACDVATVAKLFGGGGHRNAAGFRCQTKSIDQVCLEIENELNKVLYA